MCVKHRVRNRVLSSAAMAGKRPTLAIEGTDRELNVVLLCALLGVLVCVCVFVCVCVYFLPLYLLSSEK